MSLILGLAGPYCAGKSSAAEILTTWGYEEIDVDALGHSAREVRRAEVLRRFGTVDRRELGSIVFSDPRALQDLEEILHPWMRSEAERRVKAVVERNGLGLVNAALLFPMGLQAVCDAVLWIDAPPLLRFFRARKRDGTGIKQFIERMHAQRKLYPQKDREDVDIITIVNLGSRRRLEKLLRRAVEDSRMER